MPRIHRALPLIALTLLLAPSMAQADTANDPLNLGTLGTTSSAIDMSDDASVIVGSSVNGATTLAFVWSEANGMINLGGFGGSYSAATAVSADGRIIFGLSINAGGNSRVFRWTEETGMVDLGTLGGTRAYGSGASADGSVFTGESLLSGNSYYRAFRWTQETGMVDLGTLGGSHSSGYGVSGNGFVIVGDSQITGNAARHVFRWTEGTGMVDLGTLGGSNSKMFYGFNALSYDGSVITGYSQTLGNTATHAFKWTQDTGMTDLGTLGGTISQGYAVSPDGTRIAGDSQITGNAAYHAFIWSDATGMQDANTLLSDAGVNMSDVVLSRIYGFTPDNKHFIGYGYFNGSSNATAFLACYDPGENGCVGLTTASKQEEAAIDLASNQQIAMTESRSAANELLGFTRPILHESALYSGAMFGSAMGYAGGQYTKDRFTLLGGLGYGAQDYKYIKPENSLTVASGLRYTFDSVTGEQVGVGALSPFVEAGGWYTPDMEVALSRPYNNGTGTNRGEGNTNSSSWAEYVKAGLVWDQSDVNQFTAYGELGRQHMLFDGYSETATSTNPFPATISDSEMTFNFARAGGSWTRQLDKFMGKPVSFTVAGAVAHSFGVKTNLTSTVSGVGTAHAIAKKNLWAEYGGRVSSDLTDNVALNLDVTGTTGNNGMGTAIHGGAGVSLKF